MFPNARSIAEEQHNLPVVKPIKFVCMLYRLVPGGVVLFRIVCKGKKSFFLLEMGRNILRFMKMIEKLIRLLRNYTKKLGKV